MMAPAVILPPGRTVMVRGHTLRTALLQQAKLALAELATPPKLVIVQVGTVAASAVYIRHKLTAAAELGLVGEVLALDPAAGEAAAQAAVRAAAASGTTGLIVQTPLPAAWDTQALLDCVPAAKDVDGLSTASQRLRLAGAPCLLPATPLGVMRLLEHMGERVRGQKMAVIGKGRVVGAPLRAMLQVAGAEVVPIEVDTVAPAALCRTASVVMSAAGVPGLVTMDWVQPGAGVIDVGLARLPQADGSTLLRGDVDAASVQGVAAWLTAVPGGVGPLTVASLLTNVVDAARAQAGLGRVDWQVSRWDGADRKEE